MALSSAATDSRKMRVNLFGSRTQGWLVLIILVATLVHGLVVARTQGQTTDEASYFAEGYALVRFNNYDFLAEHPPLAKQLGALPLLFLRPDFPLKNLVRIGETGIDVSKTGLIFLYQNRVPAEVLLFWGRLPILLLLLLTAFFVYLWTKQLLGPAAAMLSLLLCVLCPNLLAYGTLFTIDLAVACFYFITFYLLYCYLQTGRLRFLILAGIAGGLTLGSKISGLFFLPTFIFLLLGMDPNGKEEYRAEKIQPLPLWIILSVFTLLACSQKAFRFTVIPAALIFLFLDLGNEWSKGHLCGKYTFLWERLRRVVFALSISALMIVLVYTDFTKEIFHRGVFYHFFWNLHLSLNHVKAGHMSCAAVSWVPLDWRYFPSLLLVKVPVVTLALSGLGIFGIMKIRTPQKILCLIVPAFVFLLAAMFLSNIRIGLRHILPILPFLCVMAGGVFSMLRSRWLKALVIFSVLVSFARTVSFFPDYLSFFNEAVTDLEAASAILGGSNYDWGQDNKRLAEFVVAKNIPLITIIVEAENGAIYDYYKISWRRPEPRDLVDPPPGFYALGIGFFKGQQKNPESWFRGKTPLCRVGKTFYIFSVPNKTPPDPPSNRTGSKQGS